MKRKTIDNKVWKVRKLLDYKKYHLYVDNLNEWKLFRKYDDWNAYIDPNNKPILDSEHNTFKELMEFAKKHKEYNMYDLWNKFTNVLLILMWISWTIQLFIKEFLYITLTIQAIFFIFMIMHTKLDNHNWKLKKEEMNELFKEIEDKYDEKNDISIQQKVRNSL